MRLMLAVLIAVATILSTGCGAGVETCSEPSTCSGGGSWQACCDALDCRYKLSNGTDIACDGTDCSSGSPSAAMQVAEWCMEH